MSTATEYPKRPKFFALRFARLMAKDCLANQIGPDACWLLAVIAHTEDAKGYRAPVTFFNEQLMPLVGCHNVKALDRVRDKAVASGWLHYEPGGKSKAGRYWVVVPDRNRDWDDHPTDEHEAPESSASDGYSATKSTQEAGNKAGEKRQESGQQSGREAGNIPPVPSPSPREDPPYPPQPGGGGGGAAPEKKPAPDPGPESVPVPAPLDAPAFRVAWKRYLAHRSAMPKAKRLTLHGAEIALGKLAPFGPTGAAELLDRAVMNGWQGVVFPETKGPARPPPQRPRPDEILAARRREEQEREKARADLAAKGIKPGSLFQKPTPPE
ncbi:MAG TPA: hypothetical protein VGE74_04035 [Gemmata sp.]